ncbi:MULTISPECIES: uroporphyrinogen-III C-methyltransferase [Pseudanabaena]|uniref:uroporphyrinogen-III C-methyltransferase n=2 Tax=Pseudanabaena TaxID=1152 RepID=L8N1X0_9CYAN|nr:MULTISPECIES: uroporphyrinogen-III C-methyltransferase [Pseudanabaena]ELS32730.1 uroporphyrinogen-III C-methyltransferase [Pseudanabaena biceps PCC 7429]MDG3495051.1 uroporphyrinogen-III C-methyltransferase [Pseudanabaena catenata USMAC16]
MTNKDINFDTNSITQGSSHASFGKVYLVGAGPGDAGLMTLKGKALLENCNVVLYDALVSDEILAMINPIAEKIHAGKRRGNHSLLQEETTQLLIEKAKEQAIVVRLKGGDPFIFGRGGEELADLRAAGIDVEVVPGITSGIAAPAYAGIPLTHRDFSSSVIFVTGHESAGKYRPQIDWAAIAKAAETIVVYMGLHNLSEIVPRMIAAGLSEATPVALIRQGTRSDQSELIGCLGNIVELVREKNFTPPAIAVIGNIVNFRQV